MLRSVALHNFSGSTADSTETLHTQWLLDFDMFPSTQVSIGLAGFTLEAVGETGTYAVKIGGTDGAIDGDVAVSYQDAYTVGDGHISRATATIDNPGGRQFVKVTLASVGHAPVAIKRICVQVRAL